MIDFIPVSTWRKNIGIFSGDRADQKRDKLKENSIKLANQMFNLNLIFVSPGSSKNDDDISDSILIAASTLKIKNDEYAQEIDELKKKICCTRKSRHGGVEKD